MKLKKMNFKKMASVLLAAACSVSLAACGGSDSTSSDKKTDSKKAESSSAAEITVVLDWTPNTNHTGLYVAQELGYFEDAGLDVSIVQPPEDGANLMVASGKAQFGYGFQEYLAPCFKEGEELGITAVASVIQHNTSGLISRKDKNISSPKDLEGHTYATWDMDIEKAILKYLMEKDGGDYDKLEMIPSTVEDVETALKTDQVDTVWIYYAWDGIAAKVKDLDTDFMNFGELDENLDFYSPVIIANNDYLEEHEKEAKDFMQAVKKGYEYAIENPEDAAKLLCKAVPELDEELVKESQKWLADQYQADASYWGEIDKDRWNNFYQWEYDNKVIDFEVPEDVGFTNDFIQ